MNQVNMHACQLDKVNLLALAGRKGNWEKAPNLTLYLQQAQNHQKDHKIIDSAISITFKVCGMMTRIVGGGPPRVGCETRQA